SRLSGPPATSPRIEPRPCRKPCHNNGSISTSPQYRPHNPDIAARRRARLVDMDLHPRAQSVAQALANLGSDAQPRMLPDSARSAQEAADSLGVDIGAIVKSLVFDCDGEPAMVLCSGAHNVDTAAVARTAGLPPLRRAAPDFVRSATGQSIGGVAPVGHPTHVRALLDTA